MVIHPIDSYRFKIFIIYSWKIPIGRSWAAMQMPRQAALKKAQESRDIAALKFALQQVGDWGITVQPIENYENY